MKRRRKNKERRVVVNTHKINLTDFTYWEIFVEKLSLSKKVKEHLLEKISVIIKLYNFVYMRKDEFFVKYIMDNIVSISNSLNLAEEDFYINLTDWSGMFLDRETAIFIMLEQIRKTEVALVIDTFKDCMQYGDNYYLSVSHFPYIKRINKSDLLCIIETLLVRVEESLIENYM